MKLKVCGMRAAQNISELMNISIDYVGFIFYPKSSRFVEKLPEVFIPSSIQKVGVFVNASLIEIKEKATLFGLDLIQLHGDELPAFCEELRGEGFRVIKAFRVGDDFDFNVLRMYEAGCDFFLFDAKGKGYGGNGIQFNWQLLNQYKGNKPFFLSGGIDLKNLKQIQQIQHPQLYGLDVNSKFEIAPAIKNIKKIKQLEHDLHCR